MDMSLSKFQQMVKDREAWHAVVHGITKSWTQLSDWTTTMYQRWKALWVWSLIELSPQSWEGALSSASEKLRFCEAKQHFYHSAKSGQGRTQITMPLTSKSKPLYHPSGKPWWRCPITPEVQPWSFHSCPTHDSQTTKQKYKIKKEQSSPCNIYGGIKSTFKDLVYQLKIR